MDGFGLSINSKAIVDGSSEKLTIALGSSVAVAYIRLTVSEADPSSAVTVLFAYGDNSGANPQKTTPKLLSLSSTANEVTFIQPISCATAAFAVTLAETGSAGKYNFSLIVK